ILQCYSGRMGWMLRMLLPAIAVAGCSSGGGDSDAPCSLASSGSGAGTWSFDGDPVCAIPFGGSVGIDMGFAPLDGELKILEVLVDNVHEGETGTFPAKATVILRDNRRFETPRSCQVVLTEHAANGESDGFSRTFQTVGEGT